MKTLRYVVVTALVTLGTFAAVLFSCKKNNCGSVSCQNGGTCVNNVCLCPTGYSGNSCQTAWTDVMTGTYKCSRSNCNPAVLGPNSWTSVVVKDATDGGERIDITNFDNNNTTVIAHIDSLHHITIGSVSGASGINATGDYANGQINLSFTSSVAGVGGYKCNMTMVKQ